MNVIDINKKMNKIKKEANQYTKGTKCVLCGKECTSFCNSHTIPRFVIKNISRDGKVYIPSMAIEDIELELRLKIFQANPGIKETLIFESICRECDNNVFSCVENEEILEKEFDGKVLNLYALKILLHAEYIKIKNANMVNVAGAKQNMSDIANLISMPWIFDVFEATKEIEEYKSAMKNGTYIRHKVIVDKILNRKTNFCCTTEITLPFSYEGKIINDLCNEESYATRFGGIYLLVLPMKSEQTRVVMYYRRKYSNYDTVKEEFAKMTSEEQLQAISNILLIYTEEFVYNDSILNKIKQAKDIIEYDTVNDPNPENYISKIQFLNNRKINMFDIVD